MSSSQHPIALALERQVGGATRLLATVMLLPLVDGIFPALVLAGAIDGPVGIAEVGLLIFGGSATVAVVLAEMDGGPREQARPILAVGVVLVAAAVLEAALAPSIQSVLDLAIFERFAALVILAIAAKTASARIGDLLPRPAVIIGLGALASVDPAGATLVVTPDPGLLLRAGLAGAVGVAFALSLALLGPWLRTAVDLDRFRFGSAVALGILPLSILGVIPGNAPLALAVLAVTALLAFDPEAAVEDEDARAWPHSGADPRQAGGASGALEEVDGPAVTPEDATVPDGLTVQASTDEDRAPWL